MDKQKRLSKAHSVLEKKVKTSKQKKQQSQQLLDDLNDKKTMLLNAREACSGNQGDRLSVMSCWSRNAFIQLVDRVSQLVEQEITQEKQRFDDIENQLKKETVQEQGLDHLKSQHALKLRELRHRQEQQEVEDLLQKSSSQK